MNSDRMLLTVAPLLAPLSRRARAGRRAQLEGLPPAPPGSLVLLGDSITHLGIWDEWLPEYRTLNRGVGWDTVGDVFARLDKALPDPRAVSLLIGTNDLSGLGRSRDVDDIAEQTRDLVQRIRQRAPEAVLLVNSVMPRSAWFAPRIQRLNEHYRTIAADAGATYVDLWPALADPDDQLRKELTTDGLHLTASGYRAWVDVLRPQLALHVPPPTPAR
jgi:lysophospholipase L1-like esterase